MPRPPNSREREHRSLTDKAYSSNPKPNRSGPYNRWILGTIRYFKRKLEERRARKQKENPQDKYSRRSSNATVVISLFTVVLVIVGGLQWDSLRRTDETTRAALIASQRAWVGPKNASLLAGPVAGERLVVSIEYFNSGREPAFEFRASVVPFTDIWSGIGPLPITAQTRIAAFTDGCKKWHPNGEGVVFPTGGSSDYQITTTAYSVVTDDDVVSGKKTVFISGCFLYSSYGAERHSAFCYFFRGGVTDISRLNICPGGQYAD